MADPQPASSGPFAGAVPANATTVDQLYGALLGLAWRGLGIPYTSLRLGVRQDLAVHKFADRDGAHVESTGRAPFTVEAICPFVNQLGKGANEIWQQPLYPVQWDTIFKACLDRTSGVLQHPELGALTCKCASFDTVWDGTRRGGPEVHISWIESDDTGVDLNVDLSRTSPLSALAQSCSNLDTAIASNPNGVDSQIPKIPAFQFTFTTFANSIRAVVDLPTLLSSQVSGQINGLIFQANQVEASLNKASNALSWPIYQQCEVAKEAAYQTQASLLATGDPISLFRTVVGATWPMLAATLNTPLNLLMTLNPSLMGTTVIPGGTTVRYYPPK